VKVLVIAWTSLRRLMRERSNIFFVFILPMLLILVLGAAFGGDFRPRLGVVAGGSGALGQDVVEQLRLSEGLVVRDYDEKESLVLAVERGQLEAGLVLPAGYDETLRRGDQVALEFVARPDPDAQALRNTVDSVVTSQGALLRAAAFAGAQRGTSFPEALALAAQIEAGSPRTEVRQEAVGEPFVLSGLGQFDMGAYSELLLFVFLTSMAGSAALVQSRQLGVSRRMLSTPTPVRTILAGEALGRFAVAMLQGLFIAFGAAVVFGVDWGDPLGATAIVVVFSLGAAATGMLLGAVFQNDQQAGGVGVVAGLALAALGGCMLPLAVMRIFSPTLYKVAHVTPHAWGIGAFEELILRDGTILDILPQLGVLLGFALVMFVLGVWRLRVVLTR